MATSLEDAQQCPKCKVPGEIKKSVPQAGGSKELFIYCMNPRCKWFNTPWNVTLRADGTVPDPQDHTKKQKTYQGFEGHDELAAQIRAAVEADNEASLRGAEIRRPKR